MIMSERIIIAEDYAIFRMDLEQHIGRRYDVEIETVPDGKPLIERVRDSRFSVVLTDHQMLEMSGIQAIKQIREFDQQVPIIMLSNSDIEEEALKAGATHYIDKLSLFYGLDIVLDKYLTERT